ncbi:MAG: asparagine synthase (glutamine-hydrolyzing) [Roseimicrobium sp.]
MCGIAGILNTRGEALALSDAVRRMQTAMRHRGPDDQGLWTSASVQASFAHTRLSIIDLSAAGHQPMTTPDGRYTITFNGEIYNYRALRESLQREGVAFATQTDTEVILRLFEKQGEACVEHLRGMFAFAIWDEWERSCFLARDRFGIKPLYVAEQGDRLIFASELRAVLASALVPPKTDAQALARYLQTGSVPEPQTLIEGVRMLEAGCAIHWQDGNTRQHRWWRIAFPKSETVSREEASTRTRAALLDSVEHHFVSDVPVGIFLSGGLDSTALLALAHATGRRNIQTFSIGVDDATRDESSLARRTAEHFGTQHTELRLTAEKARVLFTQFLEAIDQPTIDGFNTFTVAGLAREHGMKVVLSGLGGDELFAGYPSFAKLPQLARMARLLGPLRGLAGAALGLARVNPQLVRLSSALRNGGDFEQLYDAFRGIYSMADAGTLTQHFLGKPVPPPPPPERENLEHGMGIADTISSLELRRYMRNQLLRDSDVMSMVHGLELRVPLVDSTLFDAIAPLPPAWRLRQGKQLLLDAVPEIPDWIRHRPKSGFLFPYEQWLSTPDWQALFADSLRGLPVEPSSWYQRWAVFVFSQWSAKMSATTL